ncbi:MAG: hypothetical protein H0V37_08215 [Chloroflexia bacterium]|nr:hypothetical protein [Chloroflexia bacterium]
MSSSPDGGRLLPLIKAGLLQPNIRLILQKGSVAIAEGRVEPDGWILYRGQRYKSPSDKAFVQLMGRKAMNGWTHWYAEINHQSIVIDELRKQLSSINSLETSA